MQSKRAAHWGCPSCIASERLSYDRFANLYRRQPVIAIRRKAVHYIEEGLVQRAGDRTHLAVADQDAIDRAQMRYFRSGAGKEGLIADVKQLAGKGLFDYGNTKLACQDEDRVARDAVQYRVRQRCRIQRSVAYDKKIFAGAFGEIAVHIESDTFGITVDIGFHANELRVHIVRAGLRERGHRVRRKTVPARDADVRAAVAGNILAPGEVCDVDLNRRL